MVKMLILLSFWALLALISWNDYRRRMIPDKMVLALFITGIIAQIVLKEPGLASGITGVFTAGLPLFLISMIWPGAFGGGDIKLMAAAGMFLGARLSITALILGFFLGGLYGLVCLLLKKKGRKDKFAFGPFLCLGIVGAYFFRGAVERLSAVIISTLPYKKKEAAAPLFL